MRKTKEEAEKTKNEILDSAVKIFAENGYFNTSLEDIARDAGVTRGAIYWHFKNKIEIFDALFERLHKPLAEELMKDMESGHPYPLDQIKNLSIQMLLDVEKNLQKRQALTFFMIRCDYSGELEPFKDKHLEKKQEKMKLFSTYFARAQEKGQLRSDYDPDFLTTSHCCYMKGILVEYLNDPERFDMKSNAPRLIDYYYGLLKSPA